MELKTRTKTELKRIIEKDYGILLSDEKAQELGVSLLKLSRLAITANARKNNFKSLILKNKETSSPRC